MTQQLVQPLQRKRESDVVQCVCACTYVWMYVYNCVCAFFFFFFSLYVSVCVCVAGEITMIGCVTVSVASCEAAPLPSLSAFRDKMHTNTCAACTHILKFDH